MWQGTDMLKFTRIKDNKFDGWLVKIPTNEYLTDGSLSALVEHVAKLGHLKHNDAYRITNNYYFEDGADYQMKIRIYGRPASDGKLL